MKIDKNGISNVDKVQAVSLLNNLRTGKRVYGNVAEGLKITLKKLDKAFESDRASKSSNWELVDSEHKANIAKLKAGIRGEEMLADYLSKIIRKNKKLDGIVVFTSLASDDINEEKDVDYIPDTDFIVAYGSHLMILDAKNIATNPEMPIYMEGNTLCLPGGKELLTIHPSTGVWKGIFESKSIPYKSIQEMFVIINNKGALIWKNEDYYKILSKPIFIGDLEAHLEAWIENIGDEPLSLKLATQVAKMQIRKEKVMKFDEAVMTRFN